MRMAWVQWYKGRRYNRNHHQIIGFTAFTLAHDLNNWTLLYWGENTCPGHIARIVLSSQCMPPCSTSWCNSKRQKLWPFRTLTCKRRIQACYIKLHYNLTWCFGGATTQMIHTHPLVVVSSSKSCNLESAPSSILAVFPHFIRHNSVKYARWRSNNLNKIHQPPQEIQAEFEAANLSKITLCINSIRLISEPGMPWVHWYKVRRYTSGIQNFPSPFVDGTRSLTFNPVSPMKL